MMPWVGRFERDQRDRAGNEQPIRGPVDKLPLSSPAGGRLDVQLLVDSGVQAPHELRHGDFKDLADAEESGHGDGPTRFNLLPVAGREAKRNHVLLAPSLLLAKLADLGAQSTEEFLLICHAPVCSIARADSPRAD